MKILVMCTGGMKSTFLTTLANKESEAKNITLMWFRTISSSFQNAWREERNATKTLAQHYGNNFVPWDVMLPSKHWSMYRLSSMLFIAINYAYEHNIEQVYYGANKWSNTLREVPNSSNVAEHSLEYLRSMQGMLEVTQPTFDKDGLPLPKVHVEAPLLLINIKSLIELGTNYNTPWELTWTCEDPIHGLHCGKCTACLQRIHGFMSSTVLDPARYISSNYSANSTNKKVEQ